MTTTTAAKKPTELLFDAELELRMAAVNYASAPGNDARRRTLREAAVRYAAVADWIDESMGDDS